QGFDRPLRARARELEGWRRGAEVSVEEAVNLIAANRRWMVKVLKRLPDADFARAGVHSECGRVTLADLLAKMTGHIDHHLRFLYAKRANLGVALPPRYASEALASVSLSG
ncbi:MAG: DinB family protein, partial [Thermoleophilia bacterium]|nr:DinB family protein [Thermoleophilia bacterium]